MRVSIIAAVARNGTIGIDNRLPWRLPADLRHFRALTMGHHLVMGRRTFESVGPLPGRRTIVVTRGGLPAPPGDDVKLASSLDHAIELARAAGEEEVFIAGGAAIYRDAMDHADRIYLTRIDADFAGDASFPEIDGERWREIERRPFPPDDKNPHPYAFALLERRLTVEGAERRTAGRCET